MKSGRASWFVQTRDGIHPPAILCTQAWTRTSIREVWYKRRGRSGTLIRMASARRRPAVNYASRLPRFCGSACAPCVARGGAATDA